MKTNIAYIYGLIDPRDGRIRYIGKTINPKTRLYTHLYECKDKKVINRRINWIRNLISNNLKPTMSILKICPMSDFEKYETEYIKIYKSEYLTNSDESGQGNKNRKRDIIDNAIEKISKRVYQFDLNGNFISEYKSAREAGRVLNINHSHIVRCCNMRLNHTNQFIFRYDRNSDIKRVEVPNAVKKMVIELDLDGNVINEWKSLMDCSRDTGIDNGNISRVCNGKRRCVKNRIFRFV
jgi:NUMOD1 domain/GIY-YIG catalytic domain